ncbi:MAG: hypothetical protein Q8P05_03320 [Candidatus Diapherotrites archaeon]|nr:hypothetical protein [Candidatus Diapherotrites archaeon]MDZ4256163.1 hypothetical protein [archaeon]
MTENDERPMDKAQREKLLQELKQRLREIKELSRELGGKEDEDGEKGNNPIASKDTTVGEVREAIEELRVPPLEMLEDQPIKKKVKAGVH